MALLRRRMIGQGRRAAPLAGFGEKKPELFQARVESTMEAVEETIGAKTFSLGNSLEHGYAALQYIFCERIGALPLDDHGMHSQLVGA